MIKLLQLVQSIFLEVVLLISHQVPCESDMKIVFFFFLFMHTNFSAFVTVYLLMVSLDTFRYLSDVLQSATVV